MTTTQQELDPTIHEIYQDWQEGEIRPDEALRAFCELLAPVQDNIKDFTETEKQIRVFLGEVMAYLGDQVEIKGFGKLEITRPGVTYSYDKKQLDQLTSQLRTEGMGEVAARLDLCLKSSERVGTLRITREKPAKENI